VKDYEGLNQAFCRLGRLINTGVSNGCPRWLDPKNAWRESSVALPRKGSPGPDMGRACHVRAVAWVAISTAWRLIGLSVAACHP